MESFSRGSFHLLLPKLFNFILLTNHLRIESNVWLREKKKIRLQIPILSSWASFSASAVSLFSLSLPQPVQDQLSLRFYFKVAHFVEGEAFWEALLWLARSGRVESTSDCVCWESLGWTVWFLGFAEAKPPKHDLLGLSRAKEVLDTWKSQLFWIFFNPAVSLPLSVAVPREGRWIGILWYVFHLPWGYTAVGRLQGFVVWSWCCQSCSHNHEVWNCSSF